MHRNLPINNSLLLHTKSGGMVLKKRDFPLSVSNWRQDRRNSARRDLREPEGPHCMAEPQTPIKMECPGIKEKFVLL